MSQPNRNSVFGKYAPSALAAALVLGGCATGDTGQVGHYSIRVETPLYRYGPAQTFGPDSTLKPGEHVLLLRREFGYSRIQTDDGQTGYVATEDLVPGKVPQVAHTGSGIPGMPTGWQARGVNPGSGRGGRFAGPVLPAGPLFGNPDLPPLPEAERPEKNEAPDPSKPRFRADVGETRKQPGFRVNIPPPEAKPDAGAK